jgi:hypothetical protein
MPTKRMRIVYEETGEVRPPREGEWFRGYKGIEDRARFDFTIQKFPILRMLVVDDVDARETR